jgi:hypothetical protein
MLGKKTLEKTAYIPEDIYNKATSSKKVGTKEFADAIAVKI